MSAVQRFIRRQFDPFTALASDGRGVSAVEFALIAPLMIALYAGVVQLSQAIEVNRKFNMAAAQVADLVSQARTVSDGDLYDYFTAGRVVMLPFDTETLSMRISSLERRANGNINVLWSEVRGDALQPLQGAPQISTDILPNGSGLIMVDMEFDYTTPFVGSDFYSFTFRETVQRRPRLSATIERSGR